MYNRFKASKKFINEVLLNEFRTSKNKIYNKKLTKLFCEKIGVKFGIPLNSGTSGLHTALLALNLKKNDEVIMPAITMSAVAYSIILAGAKPIFVDIDIKSLNLDPEDLKKKVNKKTKAIICVSLFGLPVNYQDIKNIIKKKKQKIFLIEDNAECMMGKFKKKFAGSFGDYSMFSFQSSKVLTCGEGGMLVTNSKELLEKAKLSSNLGYKTRDDSYGVLRKKLQKTDFSRHIAVGYNYRLSEINAATVYGQLLNVNKIVKKRIYNANKFNKIIQKYKFVKSQEFSKDFVHGYWAYPIIFKNKKLLNIFNDLFIKYGGDYYYGCWKIPYDETFFQNLKIKYSKCLKAEDVQKRLIQMKTNYEIKKDLNKQVKILDKTLKEIKNKYL